MKFNKQMELKLELQAEASVEMDNTASLLHQRGYCNPVDLATFQWIA